MTRRTAHKLREQDHRQDVERTTSPSVVPPDATAVPLLDLQRTAGNQTVTTWLQSAPMVQRKSNNGGSADASERQADQAAEKATQDPAVTPTKSLIVDDDSKQLQPGQMRKSDFLSALRSSVSGAAEQSLEGTMWSSMGCPYIDRWFNYFDNKSSAHVERALLKYAPEAASAKGAQDYIPVVTQRVRRGISEWKETGEVKGLPEEFSGGEMPGATVSGLVSAGLSAVGSAVSGAVSGAASSIGGMFFKRRAQDSGEVDDPIAIQAQLGSGQSLDSGVKSKMEGAFGMTFSGVRVHTDAKAQELSTGLDARAFTVGKDIAFAAGEYQPDTLIGDALIAHELAHVAQQSGESAPKPLGKGGGEHSSLEEDADVSAVGAMMSTLIGAKGLVTGISRQAMPHLRSGLKLQRCSSNKPGVENAERWAEIKKLLEKIPTGKEALKVIEDKKASVRFIEGRSEFDEASNTLLINSKFSNERAALSVTHEAHHARGRLKGTTPDIKTTGREEYIRRMIEEEAEGVVRSIEAKMEFEGTDVNVAGITYPLEPEYRAAYKTAFDAAKAADPKISEADAKKAGREAGLKRVIKGFKENEVVTPYDDKPYPQYYGEEWDKRH